MSERAEVWKRSVREARFVSRRLNSGMLPGVVEPDTVGRSAAPRTTRQVTKRVPREAFDVLCTVAVD